jgi:hypothetical protein
VWSRSTHATVACLLGDSLVGLGYRAFVLRYCTRWGRWTHGELSIANEHLLSEILRDLLVSLIHDRVSPRSRTVVLATRAGEGHEFGIFFVALLALDAGAVAARLGSFRGAILALAKADASLMRPGRGAL